MRRSLLALALLLPLAACDSDSDDAFAVEVVVTDASGAPLAGYDVLLAYNTTDWAGEAPAPHAARGTGGGASMSAPAPNPWATVTAVRYNLPEAVSSARIELFDLNGTRRMQQDVPGEPGQHVRILHDDSTNALAGGVYRVVGTFGTTVREEWTIHSDGYASGSWGWARSLGMTGADGRVRTDDRAAAPSLFDVPPIVVYNVGGGAVGQIMMTPEAIVEVRGEDGSVTTETLVLRNGMNRVTLRVTTG